MKKCLYCTRAREMSQFSSIYQPPAYLKSQNKYFEDISITKGSQIKICFLILMFKFKGKMRVLLRNLFWMGKECLSHTESEIEYALTER